jgi:hypothetical protein
VRNAKSILWISLVCVTFTLAGLACAPQAAPTLLDTPTPQVAESPTPLTFATVFPKAQPPTAATVQTSQRTQYKLAVEFNYLQHRLNVNETVRYTNRSSDVLSELEFVVQANQEEYVFQPGAISWADGSSVANAQLDGEKLTLPLPQPLNPGQSIGLNLNYSVNLLSSSGTLSFSSHQINLSGWYPYLPPYLSGQGWLINSPAAVGEYQVYEPADFDVSLTLNGAPANLVVAASAANDAAQGYHFVQTNARNFTLSASTNFIHLTAAAGNILVNAYVFSTDTTAGQASLEATVKALTLFSRLYGPYPRQTLTIVEADFPDGMEEDGLYFLGSEYFNTYTGTPASYLTAISAHETAHQWWWAQVANDQAREPWLDEALATYSERLFYENEYPDLVDWWWQTRVQAFDPQGWVNSTIYDFNSFRPYVNAVYLRGAEFLEALRLKIGDEAFFAFLRDYCSSIKNEDLALTNSSQFWSILSQCTSADLSALKSDYFK